MATNVVPISSDLKRKGWMKEGLVQAASKSFWTPYTGTTKDSIVYQENNISASEGHTVVFDMDGNLSGKALKNKDTATGKGEQKKKFSSSITVDRYRLVVDNGDKFDAVDIDNLSTSEHADSRSKLGDLFVRWKDQALFDVAQGFKDGVNPTHSYQVDASVNRLTYDNFVQLEKALRTGTGFKTGTFGSVTAATARSPLAPYRMTDGRSIWLMVIDPATAANIKGNVGTGNIMSLMQNADLRGPNNNAIRGVLGAIGQLVFVEAESFFGVSASKAFEGTEVEIAGLRAYDGVNSKWAGETGFANQTFSRNLVMGQGAIQMAFGKMPDYMFQKSPDFGISSESAVEFWMNAQRTKLKAENEDYKAAKVADLDFGSIVFDVKL